MSSASSNIAHLQKLIESYKSRMISAIGTQSMQYIQNHPYHPECRIEIPNEIQRDKMLVNTWPQIEHQVLEWRKMAYLMAHLLREYAQEMTRNLLPTITAFAEIFSAYDHMFHDCSYFQHVKSCNDFSIQQVYNSIQLADAYEHQVAAYAQENNDVGAMEWYKKHASIYLPRASVVVGMLFRVRFDIEEGLPPSAMDEMELVLQRMGMGQEAADYAPPPNMQFQYLWIHDKQPTLDWVPNGIMEIRMASRL